MATNKINPIRTIASTFDINQTYLLFTIAEGAELRFLGDFSMERFISLEKDGWFEFRMGDGVTRIYPAFAELVVGIKGHDFRIDEINGDRIAPTKREVFTLNKR